MGSWFDILLIGLLAGGIGFGFFQGLLRQAFLLIAIYVGTALSAKYFEHPSALLLRIFPTATPEITNMVGFLALLVAFTVGITWLIWSGYKETKLPQVFVLDRLGGATLGGVIGLFAISITLMLTHYALQVPWPPDSTVRYVLLTGLNASLLQDTFSLPVPVFQNVLRPLLPQSVPFAL